MSDDIGPISKSNPSASTPTNKTGDRASATSRVHPDVAESVLESDKTSDNASDTQKASSEGTLTSGGPGSAATNGDSQPITQNNSSDKCWAGIDYTKPRDAVETALTDCMKIKYGQTFVDDVEDADLLLSYVTRNGIQEDKKVSDETIQTLIDTRQRMRSGLFDCKQDEAKFRKNYGLIAKAAEPVTVVSFRDSLKTRPFRAWFVLPPQPRKVAEIACLIYRRWAFFVLFLLLCGQIYWTATSSVLNKTQAIISDLNKAPTAEYYIARENERRFASWARLNPAAAAASASPAATPNEIKPDKNELTLDELTSKVAELEANYSILGKLISPFRWFYFEREERNELQNTKEDQNRAITSSPVETGTTTKRDNDKGKAWTEPPVKADDTIFRPSPFQIESASKNAVAGQVIDVMQKWFLPLLYGALGAMVFVVRTLSVQARDRLFREEARVTLVLRVFLGMISGLAIGWFWTSGAQPSTNSGGPISVSTLSPFALAFVAGYGVELFFALLDKVVSTFTNKP